MKKPTPRTALVIFSLLFHLAGGSVGRGEGEAQAVTKGNEYSPDGTPLVALTFDDGPHPDLTPRLLDILRDKGAVATFYVVGRSAKQYPEILNRIALEGHEIGNHTWSHPDLRKLSPSKIRQELERTSEAIFSITGEKPYSMRPPYGSYNKKVGANIPSELFPVVMWSVDPQDWKKPGVSVVTKRVLDGVKPGSILLLHDIHPETIQAVPAIVEGLIQKGYKLVPVSELLSRRTVINLE